MAPIENREALCSHGDAAAAREFLLDVVDGALAAVHPDRLVPERIALDGETLVVDGRRYDLGSTDRVLVVGAGKGSLALVRAVRDVLGDRLSGGVVVEKRGDDIDGEGENARGAVPDGVEVHEAGHPIPDEAGHRAARAVTDLAESAGEDDLVLACITGGASALLPLPVPGITLDELAETTRVLLEAGAPIEDVNAVRKHLSRIKGGRLAEAIHPATTVSLIIVDEVAGEPWGPTVPDPTTFADAVRALERHGLRDRVPPVLEHLTESQDHPDRETPTPDSFGRLDTHAVVLADAGDVCEAACERAEALGVEAMLLSTVLEGESREVGTCLSGIAKEVAASGRPVEPPCAIVSGGETTVTVGENAGEGGPNQEFALGAALGVAGLDAAAVAVGTDGTDGPTDLAGGLIDGGTAGRAERMGVDLHETLRRHDAANALRELGDAVYTGPTGTNVMDLRVVLVRDAE
ncbi:glycerate kinase [Salinirubellus sp. GCM10025818]|uniref:glycerate kinase type-2 family protein n=1 Tax=Salinirubellus TaxID=2162630 RepID=UPI0030D0404C